MEKILTISIAAYNVENFIEKTLESLLIDNIDDLEILVQDDNGTDTTSEIVRKYEEKYPNAIRLIHKENGGYGSTINSSIELAKGKYFKQLDGDDWYDKNNFKELVDLLKNTDADVVYTPYKVYYEKDKNSKIIDFFDNDINGQFETEDMLLQATRYLSMYTLTYKTKILQENNIKLKEKCLYTDTQYALYPIVHCKTIYVTHIPIYIYRIGREGQSVAFEGRIKHYEDHIKVTKELINFSIETEKQKSQNISEYVKRYVGHMSACSIADFLILLPTNKENLNKIKEFEKYVYDTKKELYFKMEDISRLIKLLRKSNYTLYPLLACYKRRKFK